MATPLSDVEPPDPEDPWPPQMWRDFDRLGKLYRRLDELDRLAQEHWNELARYLRGSEVGAQFIAPSDGRDESRPYKGRGKKLAVRRRTK